MSRPRVSVAGMALSAAVVLALAATWTSELVLSDRLACSAGVFLLVAFTVALFRDL